MSNMPEPILTGRRSQTWEPSSSRGSGAALLDEKETKPTSSFSYYWQTIQQAITGHLDDLGLSGAMDNFSGVLARHPMLTFVLIAAFVCIALPCIAFFVFAAATVIMTFMGFVLIEGTLISIASILLFAFLGSMVLMLIVFGGLALLGYTGFMHFYDQLFPGPPEPSSLVRLQKRRLQGLGTSAGR